MSTRYIVQKGDEQIEVSIAKARDGYQLEIGGKSVNVGSQSVSGGTVRSLLIDGRSYETAVMPSREGVDVYVSGDVFHVRVTDELWARVDTGRDAESGREEVLTPMPGEVVSIPVKPGDVVDAGETVAVVEAMKMQNEINAIRGGRVEEIRLQPGDVVETGAVLVVLGPPDGKIDD